MSDVISAWQINTSDFTDDFQLIPRGVKGRIATVVTCPLWHTALDKKRYIGLLDGGAYPVGVEVHKIFMSVRLAENTTPTDVDDLQDRGIRFNDGIYVRQIGDTGFSGIKTMTITYEPG
jgi:hypothetical protein